MTMTNDLPADAPLALQSNPAEAAPDGEARPDAAVSRKLRLLDKHTKGRWLAAVKQELETAGRDGDLDLVAEVGRRLGVPERIKAQYEKKAARDSGGKPFDLEGRYLKACATLTDQWLRAGDLVRVEGRGKGKKFVPADRAPGRLVEPVFQALRRRERAVQLAIGQLPPLPGVSRGVLETKGLRKWNYWLPAGTPLVALLPDRTVLLAGGPAEPDAPVCQEACRVFLAPTEYEALAVLVRETQQEAQYQDWVRAVAVPAEEATTEKARELEDLIGPRAARSVGPEDRGRLLALRSRQPEVGRLLRPLLDHLPASVVLAEPYLGGVGLFADSLRPGDLPAVGEALRGVLDGVTAQQFRKLCELRRVSEDNSLATPQEGVRRVLDGYRRATGVRPEGD
jgi:hypothetical protein